MFGITLLQSGSVIKSVNDGDGEERKSWRRRRRKRRIKRRVGEKGEGKRKRKKKLSSVFNIF